jgi:RNA polymerase sigma factor (sigma-70 family)
MLRGRLSKALDYLCAVVSGLDTAGNTDGELLERFLRDKDEAAFEALMRRHGPMVLGVCRRLLGNAHDAEDAFQATFLVLVCKGSSIRPRSRVGAWLHGVAHRTALEARRLALLRRTKEAMAVPRVEQPEDARHDGQPQLDEAISHLPDRYRAVIVLCELEGKPRKEAAEILGVPEGTVASRLARAKRLLARRLRWHGPAFTGGAPAVPAALVVSTREAARLVAAGTAAAGGALSARVVALAERVVRTVFLTRLKVAAVLVLAVCVLGAAGGWLLAQLPATEPPEPPPTAAAAADKAELKKEKPDDNKAILGVWRVVAVETEGTEDDNAAAKKARRWVFTPDRLLLRDVVPGKPVHDLVRTYKLDPTRTPKTLDITLPDGPDWGKVASIRAIYALDADVLKICRRLLPEEIKHRDQMVNRRRPFDLWEFLATGARPKELATREGSLTTLLTLKRRAAEQEEKPHENKR